MVVPWSVRMLEKPPQECRRFIRDADDLVRCLAIELEVELGLRPTVVPVGKGFELAPAQAPLRAGGAPDGDADARRLPRDAGSFCDGFRRGHYAARDETGPAFVLARKDEDRVALGDALAAIHSLPPAEGECLRRGIGDFGLDRENHAGIPASISVRV